MPRSPRLALPLLTSIVVAAGLGSAGDARAATCADYPNQAAAQRAKDTRDADGDGIYCESLPCPCSTATAGGSASPRPSTSGRRRVLGLGVPVLLGPRRKRTGCRARGPLPEPDCSPGAYYPKATLAKICVTGYTARVRRVSSATQQKVYAAYGIGRHLEGQYEIDHLVPLELGGSNSIANLFPEAARPRPGYHEKDQVENAAHDTACARRRPLRALQRQIARDWTTLR
ncbi:hypothetical protein NBH00_22140 [Paraconexibacter antarcticus]|uniref:Excalibur calcium-binding domain-containing protein n=1 Tax=Paraconexibacter antarcticus TaxID=2949664 RepID=A0ABY5DQY4_9ACTN|nr:hypothetical protein [Paraconexibacter antarcticus]UTI64024.1 hypothetical protein NBH00_22140 [Paraconexibacter antarcticus]